LFQILEVPGSISNTLKNYRDVFCKEAGFDNVSRYLTGLILSPNKTLQGIYDCLVWEDEDKAPSRRAVHECVFESTGWDSEDLMKTHRKELKDVHKGQYGKEVIVLDWTYTHHEGKEIFGIKESYDHVIKKYCPYQTFITGVISNSRAIDGLDLLIQNPDWSKEELGYLNSTVKENYEKVEDAQKRLLVLLYSHKNKLAYKKRTELCLELAQKTEEEGNFPQANYAFDNGVLNLELCQFIEGCEKHWVSELERSRKIIWDGEWLRIDKVFQILKETSAKSFRPVIVKQRDGKTKSYMVFSKVVRLKKYNKKRLVIVCETMDLTDNPKFLITDAKHWESTRVLETWSYRWSVEVFHEYCKQVTGLESSQVRNEESVKRQSRLSCVSQSLVQRVSGEASKSEKYEFAKGEITIGQKVRTIARESFLSVINLIRSLTSQNKTSEQILEVIFPK
jgi:hypothetical protein